MLLKYIMWTWLSDRSEIRGVFGNSFISATPEPHTIFLLNLFSIATYLMTGKSRTYLTPFSFRFSIYLLCYIVFLPFYSLLYFLSLMYFYRRTTTKRSLHRLKNFCNSFLFTGEWYLPFFLCLRPGFRYNQSSIEEVLLIREKLPPPTWVGLRGNVHYVLC